MFVKIKERWLIRRCTAIDFVDVIETAFADWRKISIATFIAFITDGCSTY
jgi:hypothetical protein